MSIESPEQSAHWKQSFDAPVSIECREPHAVLRRTIEDVLSNAPRAGAHGKFSAEQMTHIMAIACESPEQAGRPVDHWTHRELADEAKQRGIVPSISASRSALNMNTSDTGRCA